MGALFCCKLFNHSFEKASFRDSKTSVYLGELIDLFSDKEPPIMAGSHRMKYVVNFAF